MQGEGRYFDGDGGGRRLLGVTVDLDGKCLRLSDPADGAFAQTWPLDALRQLHDQATPNRMVLSLFASGSQDSALIDTARLTLRDPDLMAAIVRHAPNLAKRDVQSGALRKILTRVGLAVGAVVLMLFVILPGLANTLARYIPVEREMAYGKSVVKHVERLMGGYAAGGLTCTNPEGIAALDAMTQRLIAGRDMKYALNVAVFRHPMVNAFAAPGGQIIVVRGLIDKAESADEVAAVLAHEIGHVEARDTTRAALRAAGSAGLLSLVLGDFAGGSAVVVAAEFTLNASYTRDAEGKADAFAHEMLEDAGVDAAALGDFFDRLKDVERRLPELPVYMSSHPETGGRAQAARDFARDQGPTQPILTDAQWAALRGICN